METHVKEAIDKQLVVCESCVDNQSCKRKPKDEADYFDTNCRYYKPSNDSMTLTEYLHRNMGVYKTGRNIYYECKKCYSEYRMVEQEFDVRDYLVDGRYVPKWLVDIDDKTNKRGVCGLCGGRHNDMPASYDGVDLDDDIFCENLE